jgi:hypothetical protein
MNEHTTFLKNRTATFNRMAGAYEELVRICDKLSLIPLSGDIQDDTQWANNVNHLDECYCPERDNGILLTYKRPDRQFVIAALHVNFDGTYYATFESGGNHDMSAWELSSLCERALKALP